MTDTDVPVLSVRGYARLTVAPDSASVFGALEIFADSKVAALAEAGDLAGRILEEVAALGGVAESAETARRPLTWSTRTVATHREQIHDPQTGRAEETGRVVAHVAMPFQVRDFTLMDPLANVLAQYESFNIHRVSWAVDDDNESWPRVRADAIEAAIRQARDYARALGCSLLRVDHVADAGLLGGTGASGMEGARRMSAVAVSAGGGGPSLDPVPQELTATIEARFATTPVTLPAG